MKYTLQTAKLPAAQMLALLDMRRALITKLLPSPLAFHVLTEEQLLDLQTIAYFELAIVRGYTDVFGGDPRRHDIGNAALLEALKKTRPEGAQAALEAAKSLGFDIAHRLANGNDTRNHLNGRSRYETVMRSDEGYGETTRAAA